jgi:hypothetical protein
VAAGTKQISPALATRVFLGSVPSEIYQTWDGPALAFVFILTNDILLPGKIYLSVQNEIKTLPKINKK